MGWTHHEVGKVDVSLMDATIQAAMSCGFSIPYLSLKPRPSSSSGHRVDVTEARSPPQEGKAYPAIISDPEGDVGDLEMGTASFAEAEPPEVSDVVPQYSRVVIVGAGASGLSTAACLRMKGEGDAIVLER